MVLPATNNPFSLDPDVQLMLRAKDGCDDSFNRLCTAYRDWLIVVLMGMVGNRDTAEDLSQEVLLRAYRARTRYQPTAKFSTWLFTIATNLAKNNKRRDARRPEANWTDHDPTNEHGPERHPDHTALSPTTPLLRAERRAGVSAAVDKLNERQRWAVRLQRCDGMSYQEIGTELNTTTAAAKSIVSRAHENLRYLLRSYA